jgi:DNA-binding beta-propeller fold protein YncE
MLVMTNDLSKIFASNMGSDSVSLFERTPSSSDYKVRFIPVGRAPEAIALSPDGKQVWTATGGDSHIAIIDVGSGAVRDKLPIRSQRINRLQFTPDGKLALLSESSNGDLIVLDTASHKEIKRLRVGGNSEGILVTPDGSRAYVASEQDNFVGVIDLPKLELTGRLHPGNGPDGMAWAVQK